MRNPSLDKLQLDRPDAAVVHVRWRHAICACLCIRQSNIADPLHRQRVVKSPVFAQDTAVPVGSVFAETDIGDDVEGWKARTDEVDGLDDGALGVVGGGAEGVFRAGLEGHAEEDYGFEAAADEGLEVGHDFVQPATVLVGEGGDGGFFVVGVGYEEGVDEHGLRKD